MYTEIKKNEKKLFSLLFVAAQQPEQLLPQNQKNPHRQIIVIKCLSFEYIR